MRELYPVFMKLSGRKVLIAGGGKLARQKLATLEPTGADVVVAAPWIDRDGSYSVLAITEVGWVYQARETDEWVLVGRIYHDSKLRRGTGNDRFLSPLP